MIRRRGSKFVKCLAYTSGSFILLLVTLSLVPRPDLENVSRSVRMWVDIPNSFPWRYCLREYNGVTTLVACEKVRMMICKILSVIQDG